MSGVEDARPLGQRWLGVRRVAVAGWLVCLVIGAACGDDDDDSAEPSTTERPATTTTEPPGTDPAEVRPYVEELIARLDVVTDQIVRDPTVVEDLDSELIEEFRSIYAPDAEGVAGALSAFRRDAEAGTHAEPLDSETTARTTVTGSVETVDEDTVKVPVCFEMTYRKVDSDGNVLEHVAQLAQPGEVVAVRVEGQWRLERSDIFSNTVCTAGGGPA